MKNPIFWTRAWLTVLFLGATIEVVAPPLVEARPGSGRSMGRRSSGFGSQRSAPPPRSNDGPADRSSPQQANPYANPSSSPGNFGSNAARGGGFMRNLAGGLAGGFLGSMLFSSLGRANGVGGMVGGGFGLLEILLLGGLAFLAFRWFRQNRQTQMASATAGYRSPSAWPTPAYEAPVTRNDTNFAMLPNPESINTEVASDIFFKVQGAWTRRDLGPIASLLDEEIARDLGQDMTDLRANQQVNRLENIAIRKTEVVDSWREDNADFARVRFTANLLDYTVDEKSGQVVKGSTTEPVKFVEDWTFRLASPGGTWRLSAIDQV